MEYKYYLSVATIFKDESHIMKEWIEHYLDEGVEHFYMINHNSTDDYLDIINEYQDKITLMNETRDLFIGNNFRHDNIFQYKEETKWIITVDLDEFAYSKNGFAKISDYLKSLSDEISQVSCPWKMFGSCDFLMQPLSVIQNFVERQECLGQGFCVKSIVRTDKLLYLDTHTSHISEGKNIISDGTVKDRPINTIDELTEKIINNCYIVVNHYVVQSWNWFKYLKMNRTDVMKNKIVPKTIEYFNSFNHKDLVDYELMLKKFGFPISFDYKLYSNYSDLNHLRNFELLRHYKYHGIKEGRIATELTKRMIDKIILMEGSFLLPNINFLEIPSQSLFKRIIGINSGEYNFIKHLIEIEKCLFPGGYYLFIVNKRYDDPIDKSIYNPRDRKATCEHLIRDYFLNTSRNVSFNKEFLEIQINSLIDFTNLTVLQFYYFEGDCAVLFKTKRLKYNTKFL